MTQGHRHAYTSGSAFVVRVAGLSLDLLRQLRFQETMQIVDEALLLERWLSAEAEPFSEALYPLIGAVEDKALRRRLVALRRAIFQIEPPRRADLGEDVWAALPAALAERLRRWLARIERRQTLLGSGGGALEREWTIKRQALLDLARDRSFQQGLMLASKELYGELRAWLRADPATVRSNRKLEVGLLLYLTRMAAKTSPYTTFTSTVAGQWTASGAPFAYDGQGWSRRSSVELNRRVINQIADALTRWPEVRSRLTLRINSSLYSDPQSLHFLTWRRGEVVVKLPRTTTLQQVITAIQRDPAPSYRRVVQDLTTLDGQNREAEIAAFVDQLLDLGLLDLSFDIPDQSLDYLRQLITWLRGIDAPQVVAVVAQLEQLHQSVHLCAVSASPEHRFALLRSIDQILETIFATLDLSGSRDRPPAKNVIYEDSLIGQLEVTCALPAWRETLDDLALLQRVVGLFDPCLPGRLRARSFFVTHYGREMSVPLLSFYKGFHHRLPITNGARPYHVSGFRSLMLSEHAGDALPELHELVEAQRALAQALAHQSHEGPHIHQLDRERIRALSERLPPFVAAPRSMAFYCQVLLEESAPQLVLNAIQTGFGRSVGRLRHLAARIERRPELLPPPLNDADEPIYADIAGLFNSNINQRLSDAPYEIVYPGYISHRPPTQQIQLSDLLVCYDPASDRLRLISARLKREVAPLHLGLMGDIWLPPLYVFLIEAFSQGPADPSPLDWYRLAPPTRKHDAIRRHPRVCLGNIIINRARWLVESAAVPLRAKGETAFDHLVRFQRWLVRHQIPRICFVRVGARGKYRKPLFVDFDNYLAVLMFERAMGKAEETIIFEEALPGPDQLTLSDGDSAYVSEYVFEMTQAGAR